MLLEKCLDSSTRPLRLSKISSLTRRCAQGVMGNCEASGLSVFTAKSDALRLVKRVQALASRQTGSIRRFSRKRNLLPQAGKLMHTPRNGNSHTLGGAGRVRSRRGVQGGEMMEVFIDELLLGH